MKLEVLKKSGLKGLPECILKHLLIHLPLLLYVYSFISHLKKKTSSKDFKGNLSACQQKIESGVT